MNVILKMSNPFNVIPNERVQEFTDEVESAYLFEAEDLGDTYIKRLPTFFDFLIVDSFDDYIEEVVTEILEKYEKFNGFQDDEMKKEILRSLVHADGQIVLDFLCLANRSIHDQNVNVPIKAVW